MSIELSKEPDFNEDRQSYLQEKCCNNHHWNFTSFYVRFEVQSNKGSWGSTNKDYYDPPEKLNWNKQ